MNLIALFRESCRRYPNLPAIVGAGREVLYHELDTLSDAVAQGLLFHTRERGPHATGGVIAIDLPRSIELVVAVLAVLKTGASYLTLDHQAPDGWVDGILSEHDHPLVIGQGQTSRSRRAGTMVDIGRLQASSLVAPLPLAEAPAVACLFYTSGTSGRPKGVRVTPQGIARMARDPDYVHVRPSDRIAGLANPAFDAFNFELWASLLNGACLSLFEQEDLRSPPAFATRLRERKIDSLFVTASLFHLMMSDAPDAFAQQRAVLVGGEALDPHAARTFQRHNPESQLVNAYGPTECATFAVAFAVPPGFEGSNVPIGRPIRDTGYAILSETGTHAPEGTPGELYLTGAGIAEGYHLLPEETTRRFVTLPGSERRRAYRTGDIVRQNAQGHLEWLGRADNQVKVRGFRIELTEIEHALCAHPTVQQAVVVAAGQGPSRQLHAFVVSGDGMTDELARFLAASLPTYMVPQHFIAVPRIPFNANGKADRARLLQMLAEPAAPKTPREGVVANLCAELLGRGDWSVERSFLQGGGDSLSAMRLIARLEQRTGVALNLRDVLVCPSLRTLQQWVDERVGGTSPALHAVPITEGVLASSEQQRMWLLHMLQPTSRAYHTPFVFTLTGALDEGKLRRAFQSMADRHQAMRSHFRHDPQRGLRLDIAAKTTIDLPIVDVSAQGIAADWRRLAHAFFGQPFDLTEAPLFRACLLRRGHVQWTLLLDAHHIVLDGQSMNVLLDELSEMVRIDGELPQGEKYDYADYCVWQRRDHDREAYRAKVAYWADWHRKGKETPSKLLASDPECRGRLLTFALEADATAAVKHLAQERGTTLFSLLLSGFALMLGDFLGRSSLTIGTALENRHHPAFERIVGMFANTLPLRFEFESSASLDTVLARANAEILDALAHRDVAYEHVVDSMPERARHGEAALFDTLFVLENMASQNLSLPGVSARLESFDSSTAKFPLVMAVTPEDGGLSFALEYQTKHFSTQQANALAEAYSNLLRKLPDAALGRPLGDEPLWRALDEDGGKAPLRGRRSELPFRSLGKWFETQALLTPRRTALIHGSETLNYGELHQRSHRLAHYLRERFGVRRGDTIALYADPSLDAMTSIVAMAKLGVSVLVLDASYPAGVLARILGQSGVKAILHASSRSDDALLAEQPRELQMPLDLRTLWENQPDDDSVMAGEAEDVLYTVYTSGSTGVPKGCQVRQETLINLLNWQFETLGLEGAVRTLQFSSLAFDVAMQEIHGTLCGGGTLVLIDQELKRDHVALLRCIEQRNIERIFLPYVALQSLAEAALALDAPPRGLREVVTAGEQLYCSDAVRAFFRASPEATLINMYGPSETHVVSALTLRAPAAAWPMRPAIGVSIDNTDLYVLDERQRPVPRGVMGEIVVQGLPVWRCYHDNPAANLERVPMLTLEGSPRLVYRTGDLGYIDRDGQLVFVERGDDQVKINGYRIECGHIEAALLSTGQVDVAVVVNDSGRLVAYVKPAAGVRLSRSTLSSVLGEQLPPWMLPAEFRLPEAFPRTPSGKIDRKALLRGPSQLLDARHLPEEPRAPERDACGMGYWALQIARLVEQELGSPVDPGTNFFDAGFNSIRLVKLHVQLIQAGAHDVRLVDLFAHPSAAALARHLSHGDAATSASRGMTVRESAVADAAIAVIGMALRVPGALDLAHFWENILANREGIEVLETPDARHRDRSYWVRARASLDGIFDFDPGYFGISEQEAGLMDPQQRHLLMGAVHALDHAGYGAHDAGQMRVGVFVSAGENHYQHGMAPQNTIDPTLMALHQEKDFLATKIAWNLDLKGPALSVQTACSSSLVAIHQACMSLRAGDADIMLAGGVMVDPTHSQGYSYKPGHIFSADGHCSPFSDAACGTVGADGYGLVVLKPLAAAVRDGDTIYAVIEGSATNNDGRNKVGYTAPSVEGQASVIRESLRRAGRRAGQVGYVEAHGTATTLGDPIEIEALSQAFADGTEKPRACAIASVKSQIGHLGAAAGVVGLIRTCLALHHRILPPNLGYRVPHPAIDFDRSPFRVNPLACPWTSDTPRVAGVSSFGMGGTNCHVTLAEAPAARPLAPPDATSVRLSFHAHTADALALNVLHTLHYLQRADCDLHAVGRALARRKRHGKWHVSGEYASVDEARSKLPQLLVGLRQDTPLANLDAPTAGGSGALPWDFPPYPFLTAQYALDGTTARPLKIPFGGWLSEPIWHPDDGLAPSNDRHALEGHRCLILCGPDFPHHELAAALRGHGADVLEAIMRPGDTFERHGDSITLDPVRPEHLAELASAFSGEGAERWTVCYAPHEAAPRGGVHELLSFVQAWQQRGSPQSMQWMLLSRQAFMVEASEDCDPRGALLLGPARVLPLEYAGVRTTLIDLPATLPARWFDAVVARIQQPPAESGPYALRGHAMHVRKSRPLAMPIPGIPECLRPGVYLIFGGHGGIGRALTERLAGLLPGSHFILLGRTASSSKLPRLAGCTVEAMDCDMADAESMEGIARELRNRHSQVAGILHCAGTAGGTLLPWRTVDTAEQVLAAKVDGCANLERFFLSLKPRFVVYSSSMSALFGGMGQSDYCAANGFVDAWAASRHGRSDTLHLSIDWDVWKGTGMAQGSSDPTHDAHLQVGMSPDQGFLLLLAALQLARPQLQICTTPLESAAAFYEGIGTPTRPAPDAHGRRPATPAPLDVKALIARQLELDRLDDEKSLFELGVDSLQALDLLDAINAAFGTMLSLDALMSNFTVHGIRERIRGARGTAGDEASPLQKAREGDTGHAVVLIHPIGGDVLAYRGLIAAMGTQATIYTLQDPRLQGQLQDVVSIQRRAELYRRLLDETLSAEQVSIVGWSFGALVAHEMACQAEREQRAMHRVVLIDPPPPSVGDTLQELDAAGLLGAFKRELEPKLHAGNGVALSYRRKLYEACASNMQSILWHRPAMLSETPLLMLQATEVVAELPGDPQELLPAWQRFCARPVEHALLVGDHYSILADHNVRALSHAIGEWLG